MLNLFITFAALSGAAAPPPVSDFVKPPTVESMKMSPDGRYLAMVAPQSDYETMLVVLDAKTLKAVGGLKSAKQRQVGNYWWVSDDRLIVATAQKFGGLDEPQMTGKLFAVDADGSNVVRLYGEEEGDQQVGSRIKSRAGEQGFAVMFDPLPNDAEYAIIAIYDPHSELQKTELYEVNEKSAARQKITQAPLAGATFMSDHKGRPRYAFGNNTEGWHQLYDRGDADDWKLVNDESKSGLELTPLAVSSEGVYMQVLEAQGPGRIVMWTAEKGEGRLVHQSKVAEPVRVLVSADGRSVFGVVTAEDRMDVAIVDPESAQSRSLLGIAKNFKGQLVEPLSWSRDGKLALIEVSSDRNSGEYYLFNRESGKAQFLLARDEWLDPETMKPRTPVTIAARDEVQLNAYLTQPSADAKAAPMVVLVHGGPHGVRDHWLWEPWSQLLASRGYAVLQVNFRGSGGYGQAHETSGYRQWGGSMADDLTDATKWAIAKGHADPKRICIMGASFGGYAALMGVTREPDLYRCAISYAGVSDLKLMYNRGDIGETKWGRRYLERVLGKDEAVLEQWSPARQADRIKAPVLLIHGGEDQRVPIAHAKNMRAALKKRDKPVEFLDHRSEGHGFYRQENRLEVYERVLAFLEANTGA